MATVPLTAEVPDIATAGIEVTAMLEPSTLNVPDTPIGEVLATSTFAVPAMFAVKAEPETAEVPVMATLDPETSRTVFDTATVPLTAVVPLMARGTLEVTAMLEPSTLVLMLPLTAIGAVLTMRVFAVPAMLAVKAEPETA